MSGPTNETGLVKAMVREVQKVYPDAWVMKVHGGPDQSAGIPDLLLCVDGHFIGAEVKYVRSAESISHARGRASVRQLDQIDKIRRAGGTAAVVVTVEELLELVSSAVERGGEQ